MSLMHGAGAAPHKIASGALSMLVDQTSFQHKRLLHARMAMAGQAC